MIDEIQEFWDNLLSEQPEKIRETYTQMDAKLQQHVLVHLYKMINEPGWHPAQVGAAQFAINTIEESK